MRLIDADELSCEIKEASKEAGFYRPIYEGFLNTINRSPTIEAEPVRHGKCIPDDNYWLDYNYWGVGNCNLCGAILKITDNYCFNCGAKMDGGDNDGQTD